MRKILLIEDDPPTIEIYKEILKKAKAPLSMWSCRWGKCAICLNWQIKYWTKYELKNFKSEAISGNIK